MILFSKLKQTLSNYSVKSKIITVLWITLIWTLIRLFKFFETYAGNKDSIEINEGIVSSILIIMSAGLIIGGSLVFLWERWLRKMAYFKALFFILLFYSFIFYTFYSLEQGFALENDSNQLPESRAYGP